MHSIYEKELSLIFYSYALVDQDIPLCSTITSTVPNRWRMEVHTPPSLIPDVVVFFPRALWELHKSLDAWRLQLQAAAFIRTFRTALHDTKAATQAQARKGRPVPAAFVPFHNNWDSCNSIHTNSFLYFALSPPVSLQKTHSFSNEQSHNAMTVNI